jgi:hypothetical protein
VLRSLFELVGSVEQDFRSSAERLKVERVHYAFNLLHP